MHAVVRREGEGCFYFGGSLTLLESHAWRMVSMWEGEAEWEVTYQALEDALACRCAAGLDLPNVVFGNFLELELIRYFFRSHR